MSDSSHNQEHALFSSLPLRPELLQALGGAHYDRMTAIQAASASEILAGRDILAQAQTGSGKTVAFAIGILNKLEISLFETQALVICPTRELSDQVAEVIQRLASGLANTRVLTLCGGKPMHDQLTSLKREPHVVVGTPGRLKKHLEKGTLNVSNVKTLVLDEADRMLDMGFYEDIMSILEETSQNRQTLLFSATYPNEITRISQSIQNDPVNVKVASNNHTVQIDQLFVLAKEEQKLETLYRALGKFQPENAIIFCNRKKHVQALCDTLTQAGYHARALHGDLDQRERDEAILLFANKSISLLIATDVAARGLDISGLSAVINYDITPDPENHVHRIGRTGRAGMEGLAITLFEPDEEYRVRAIEEFMETSFEFGELQASDKDSGSVSTPPTRTLQLSAGKKDKIRPGDIVGALTASEELLKEDIGKIKVQAKVAFVAVAYAKAKTALKIISEERIKKKNVRARIIR